MLSRIFYLRFFLSLLEDFKMSQMMSELWQLPRCFLFLMLLSPSYHIRSVLQADTVAAVEIATIAGFVFLVSHDMFMCKLFTIVAIKNIYKQFTGEGNCKQLIYKLFTGGEPKVNNLYTNCLQVALIINNIYKLITGGTNCKEFMGNPC